MCIFTSPSVAVADTRLFARLTGDARQILVYEMSYGAGEDLAMVLPLPVASRDERAAVTFIDLSALPDFFDRLTRLIWRWEFDDAVTDDLSSNDASPTRPPLKVHKVGAFDASFVPSIADFDRLDARFKLSESVWDALPQYRDFGFAVFRLRETAGGLKAAHPMALDFSSRFHDSVFLPTVHVHDGAVHQRAWFDHLFFVQGKRFDIPAEPLYFHDGLEIPDNGPMYLDLSKRRGLGWKIERHDHPDLDRFGTIWPAGNSEVLKKARKDETDRKVLQRLREMAPHDRQEFTKDSSYSWTELLPILDLDMELYAFGKSGLLLNTDTQVKVL